MTPCFYVLPACTAAQKQRLRRAAAPLPAVFRDECGPEERRAAFAAARVLFGDPKPARLAEARALRWLQLTWAGADRYTAAALPAGLTVTCATGAYGGVIAEYIVGTLLALCRDLPRYFRQQSRALWEPHTEVRRIAGAAVLILGAGDIGTETARRLRPFGPRLWGVRRTARAVPPEFDAMYTPADLPDLLPRADMVIGCLPATAETRGLLGEAALQAVKPGALLVNAGRGSLVDTDALVRALRAGRLGGAALDVTDPEPLPPDHPLWTMDNVLLTPHIAGIGFGSDPQTQDRIVDLCCENLRRWHGGRPLRSVVDLQIGYAGAEK